MTSQTRHISDPSGEYSTSDRSGTGRVKNVGLEEKVQLTGLLQTNIPTKTHYFHSSFISTLEGPCKQGSGNICPFTPMHVRAHKTSLDNRDDPDFLSSYHHHQVVFPAVHSAAHLAGAACGTQGILIKGGCRGRKALQMISAAHSQQHCTGNGRVKT
jgi:hypothetical protein